MGKRFKELLILGLASIMTITCSAQSKIKINYNGQEIGFDKEVKLIDSTILLPLRAVSQELGYTVNYTKRSIEISGGETKVILTVGSTMAVVNGEEVKLNIAPDVIEGTTYVPLRFIGEALNLQVDWDDKKQTINLEGKYSVDRFNKKLMVRTKAGKEVLTSLTTLEDDKDSTIQVTYETTKNKSEIVSVSQTIQGALTGYTSAIVYIKDGKVIDKIERPFHHIGEAGIAYFEDEIALGCGEELTIYDDKTGACIKKYDLSQFQKGLNLDLMKLGRNYVMGRYENTIHIIDFKSGKVTRVLDLIPKEDQPYVFQSDLYLATDDIKLVWETDEALVFKYYSLTNNKEETVVCKLG